MDTATLRITKTRKSQLTNKNNTILGESMQNMHINPVKEFTLTALTKTEKANLKPKYYVDVIKNNM